MTTSIVMIYIEDFYENKNSLTVCPTFFEEYIDKEYDIRVVVIGKKYFRLHYIHKNIICLKLMSGDYLRY